MQGSTVISVCWALKVGAQLLQGVQFVFHVLSISAIAVRPCLDPIFLLYLFLWHPFTGGIRKRSLWTAFLGQGGGLFPRAWRRNVKGLAQTSNCTVALRCQGAFLGVMVASDFTPWCRDPQLLAHNPWCCWPRVKWTQCTKSQPCSQGKDRHTNMGKKRHRAQGIN